VPEWVLFHPELSPTAVRVYAVLDRFGSDPETCYPSHAAIAERAQLSERSVARPLAELVAAGAVVVRERYTEGGRQTSNAYTLAGDAPLLVTAHSSDPAHAEARTTTHAEARTTTHAEARDEREPEEREPEEGELTLALADARERAPSDDEFESFERWWVIYPRRVDKARARKAYRSALTRADAATLLAGASRYAHETRGSELRFVKHPATWLNADSWLDEPGANRRSSSSGPRAALDTADGTTGRVVEL
jgi:hypothetical protein